MATRFFSADSSTNVRSEEATGAGPRWTPLGLAARLWPGLAARWAAWRFCTPPRRPLSDAERRLLPSGRLRFVGRAPYRLAVWSWGRGPRVVLVHGWGGRGAQLGAFVAPLVAAGFSVVTFDGPAHGFSDGRRSSLPELADALRRVVREVGPAYAVVAHSLGAAATALAMRQGLHVERVAFFGPPADPRAYLQRFLARLGAPGLEAAIVRGFEPRFGLLWADIAVPALARRMTVPLLVVHDRQDREVPWADGAAVAASWPGATLETTTGLGHRRLLSDETIVARAVAFLSDGLDECARPIAPADDARCATPGCARRGVEAWDDGLLCCVCALERELFEPDARWRRARALAGAV